jgi:hypothetical protein
MHKKQNTMEDNLIYEFLVAINKLLDSYSFYTLKILINCLTFVKILII